MSVVVSNWPFLYVFSNLCNPQISKVNAKRLGGLFGSPNIFPSRSMTWDDDLPQYKMTPSFFKELRSQSVIKDFMIFMKRQEFGVTQSKSTKSAKVAMKTPRSFTDDILYQKLLPTNFMERSPNLEFDFDAFKVSNLVWASKDPPRSEQRCQSNFIAQKNASTIV